MSFSEESQKRPEAFHVPWAHIGTGAVFNTQFWNCCSLYPPNLSYPVWILDSPGTENLVLVAGWLPSVPEVPPFCRMVLTAPRVGRGCCQTLDALLSKSFLLFPPMLWLLLCPAARVIAQMWLEIALQERVQTENTSWSSPCKHLRMQCVLGLNVSQWCF